MSWRELPAPEEKTDFVRFMFDSIARRYDLVNRIITLGLDRRWRRRTIESLGLSRGALVLDLGCGTGDLLREAARAGLRGVGLDLSFGMLREARVGSDPLIEGDAAALPIATSTFDGVVSGFALRNFTDQEAVFVEVMRVLHPGGRFVILEVDRPTHLLLRVGHGIWFNRVVPRIGAILSVASAYRYLPRSVAYLPSGARLTSMLDDAGFIDIERRKLHGGLAQIIFAMKGTAHP